MPPSAIDIPPGNAVANSTHIDRAKDSVLVPLARRLCQIRELLGIIHLLVPRFALCLLGVDILESRARRVIRLLGARQLIQAILTTGEPTAAVLWLGSAVDAAHGASMIGLALGNPRWRRAAIADATIATMFAALGAFAVKASGGASAPTKIEAIRNQYAQRVAHRLVPRHFAIGGDTAFRRADESQV